MAEACQRERWNHTAAVLAMLANVNRDPKKGRTFRPKDFHPLDLAAKPAAPLKGDIQMLKVFVPPPQTSASLPPVPANGVTQ